MRAASANTLSILATGQFYIAECFQLYLPHAALSYYFTSWDRPLPVGGNTYLTGLTVVRDAIKLKAGLEVQTLGLTVAPQPDTAAPILVEGFPFLQACRNGELDAARVTMSKLFMPANNPNDVSAGLTPWFQGRVNQIEAGRVLAKITVGSDLELLNVSMPRNVYQVGCLHTLYDAGCTLTKAPYTFTGTVANINAAPTQYSFQGTGSAAAKADHYFDLGIITMTSGLNNGDARVVKTSLNSNGSVTVIFPWANAPQVGDTFSAVAGCDKMQQTCITKFNNLAHFRGYPYVPEPETLLNGGADMPYHGLSIYNTPGSSVPGRQLPGTYRG